MRKQIIVLFLLAFFCVQGQEDTRIQGIKNNLEALSVDNAGLTENLKLDINVAATNLSNFLLAISKVHSVNINVDPQLSGISIVNNFSNVTIAELLVFLCKEYKLDIDFTGSILSIKKYVIPAPKVVEKEILVSFNPLNNTISMDLQGDALGKVFRKVINVSGNNMLYSSGMETIPLNFFVNNVPFEVAMEKLAGANSIEYTKSKDGFYLFNRLDNLSGVGGRVFGRGKNMGFQVLDTVNRLLSVDFVNTPIAQIINEISNQLNLDVYTATPLEEAGNVTFKARQIHFDILLERIFESQSKTQTNTGQQINAQNRTQGQSSEISRANQQSNSPAFTFKKEGEVYFFGTSDQLSVRKMEIVQMMHRSIELLGDPMQNGGGRSAGRTSGGSVNYLGGGFQGNQGYGNNQFGQGYGNNQGYGGVGGISRGTSSPRRINTQRSSFNSYDSDVEALVNILPDELISDLDIKVDYELNSFLVSGPASNINRFKTFIKKIDKPVPVILIEVMLIEVRKSASVETGISWGIGDEPVTETRGKLFPESDITLGANTVNKIIGGFDGFGSFNIGKVVPNFFATIKAMEQNGNLKIRSTPKLSTLNGHRANLSIGETTYYVVTNQNFFGSQIPTSSEVRNYQPIDAELAVSIKPLVSGNGQVTLDINVIQSDFSGERIEADAPPGLTSREFSSIIRMQNQDLAVLGGLEEKTKNDSGNGVPLLARIPIIKWFFSKKKREDSVQKLTILIKPTVIY